MAYYQGDYYQGDYYQGDPFLGSLLKWGAGKLIGGIRKVFRKKIPGIGPGTGMVPSDRGMFVRTAGSIARVGAGAVGTGMAFGAGERMMLPAQPFPTSGPLPGRGYGQPMMAPGQAAAGCCPAGFHLNKSVSRARASFGAAPGTICVKNRSMNVANPRALRRGLRRVSGFGKLAQRSKASVRRAAKSLGA